jgi:hypothetical protein
MRLAMYVRSSFGIRGIDETEASVGSEINLADRVRQLEARVVELQKAIEVLLHNPNWRELISLSPSEKRRLGAPDRPE